MGVAPTGALFKGLTFDGESSKDFGIYITGTGVYNAPTRDVEMIAIPGRNGELAQDNGRFSNVEVTYHCGLFGPSQTDFAEAVSEFRNLLLSRQGYVRLEDEYNPDEYRMAVYKDGLDVDVVTQRSGEFDVTFYCKPQRFLKSGETAVAIESGDTLTNPTRFNAHPMLALEGVGTITIGDDNITVNDVPLGWIKVNNGYPDVIGNNTRVLAYEYPLDMTNVNNGDTIQIGGYFGTQGEQHVGAAYQYALSQWDIDVTTTYGTRDFDFRVGFSQRNTNTAEVSAATRGVSNPPTFTAGTTAGKTSTATITVKNHQTSATLLTVTITATFTYNATRNVINFRWEVSETASFAIFSGAPTYADSSKSTLPGVTYVDLDIAEAYTVLNGETVSANDHVIIGANVPSLPPGVTEIAYDNTITDLSITPRWWKI